MFNMNSLPYLIPIYIILGYMILGFPFMVTVEISNVQGTCSTSGDGLQAGLSWVQATLAQRVLHCNRTSEEALATLNGKSNSYSWRSAISIYFMHTPKKGQTVYCRFNM